MDDETDTILSPHLRESLRNLELRARKIAQGLLHGTHASRRLGVSTDFDHHKTYQPGDAIRHIDWRATAKHDKTFVKRFREDTALDVHLLLDISGSMAGESVGHSKAGHARLLAASLACLVINQGDRIGLCAMSGGRLVRQPLGSSDGHMAALLSLLVRSEPQGADNLARNLATLGEQNLAKGMLVFISDLMFDPEPVQRELATLHHQGHEVIVVNVRDTYEEGFPFRQWIRFVDLEGVGRPVKIDTALLRRLYEDEYRNLMADWDAWRKHQDIHWLVSRSDAAPETAILEYIQYRNRVTGLSR
jgi:uncharacterized protein (DUF58 family)